MTTTNRHSNWIALFHATGKLFMEVDKTPNGNEYRFEFSDLNDLKREIIEIAAHYLSMKNRFGCQSKPPYSVLRHSYNVGVCLDSKQKSKSVVFAGLMHDLPEAFLADIPKPFKTDEDVKREVALMKATPWEILHGDLCHSGDVKYWDGVALLCESEKYGHSDWTWYRGLNDFVHGEDKRLYQQMMQVYDELSDGAIKALWTQMVSDIQKDL